MEEEYFNFTAYQHKRQLCIKPYDDGRIYTEGDETLGLFDNCTVPSIKTPRCDELYNEFYSGNGRFYMYDIKLCHTQRRVDYKKFLKEFIRRGNEYPCIVHISNSTVKNEFNSLTSIYDLNYFSTFLGGLLTVEQELVIEISDKRVGPTPEYDMFKINDISKILEDEENVKHFMIREEVYKRKIKKVQNHLDVRFLDDYETLHKEIIRYDTYNE